MPLSKIGNAVPNNLLVIVTMMIYLNKSCRGLLKQCHRDNHRDKAKPRGKSVKVVYLSENRLQLWSHVLSC